MSLKIPSIDDKTFDQLVEEAKRLVPQHNKEWTNYNPSDPGVMVLELFAWLTENMLFRMDQIPDKNIHAFLRLIRENHDENAMSKEEAIIEAIKENSQLRAVTDNDIISIVYDILSEYGLTGKVYPLNNTDLTLFDIDPETAKDRKNGHVTLLVVTSCRKETLIERSEKKQVVSENDALWEALSNNKDEIDAYIEYEESDEELEFELQELQGSGADYTDFYGMSASMYGDNIVIGAPWTAAETPVKKENGAVYLYSITGRDDQGKFTYDMTKINSPVVEKYMIFGQSVHIGERYMIIAAPGRDTTSTPGNAFIYGPDANGNWIKREQLTAPGNTQQDKLNMKFASDVCINNNFAFVGACGIDPEKDEVDDSSKQEPGAVYVYQRHVSGSWQEVQCLRPNDSSVGDLFGASIAMTEEYAVIGAPGKESSDGKTYVGAVYIFKLEGDTWEEIAKLVPTDETTETGTNVTSQAGTRFGKSVQIDGNNIIIASDFDNDPEVNNTGKVYLYTGSEILRDDNTLVDQWKFICTFTFPEKTDYYKIAYAFSIAISGYTIAISARGRFDPMKYCTIVYIYRGDTSNNWELVKSEKWYPDEIYPDGSDDEESSVANIIHSRLACLYKNRLVTGFSVFKSPGIVYLAELPLQLTIDDYKPSPDFLQIIYERLLEKRILTTKLHVRGPIFKQVKLEISVKGLSNIKTDDTITNIKRNLLNFYDPVTGGPDNDGYPIGRTIYNSEFIYQVEAAEGVDYLSDYKVFVFNKKSGNYEKLTTALNVEAYEILNLDPEMTILFG